MLGNPDEQGRYALSGREYYAIRFLFGMVSCFQESAKILKDRANVASRSTWRDIRMVSSVCDKILDTLLSTIPYRKLAQIKTELSNTMISVDVTHGKGLPAPKKDAMCYVPEKAVESLINNMIDFQCFSCQKSLKEAKKCPYRKSIDDCFPYEPLGDKQDMCRYSGLNFELEYEQEA